MMYKSSVSVTYDCISTLSRHLSLILGARRLLHVFPSESLCIKRDVLTAANLQKAITC